MAARARRARERAAAGPRPGGGAQGDAAAGLGARGWRRPAGGRGGARATAAGARACGVRELEGRLCRRPWHGSWERASPLPAFPPHREKLIPSGGGGGLALERCPGWLGTAFPAKGWGHHKWADKPCRGYEGGERSGAQVLLWEGAI